LSDAETLTLFSELVTSGDAWSLQGHYGRTAMDLIQTGCRLTQNGYLFIITDEDFFLQAAVRFAPESLSDFTGIYRENPLLCPFSQGSI
jgi:hypothetical protein